MAPIVEADETAGPVGKAQAGAVLPEARERDLAEEIEQAWCLRRSWRWRLRGQGRLVGQSSGPGIRVFPNRSGGKEKKQVGA